MNATDGSVIDELDVALQTFLREHVATLGMAWFQDWRETLRRDGRALEGGWPGTMAEARARVLERLGPELARRALPFPSHQRVARASAEVYAVARQAWRSKAV